MLGKKLEIESSMRTKNIETELPSNVGRWIKAGTRLRELRKSHSKVRLKQSNLAGKLGVSTAMVSQVEQGNMKLPERLLVEWTDLVGVKVEEAFDLGLDLFEEYRRDFYEVLLAGRDRIQLARDIRKFSGIEIERVTGTNLDNVQELRCLDPYDEFRIYIKELRNGKHTNEKLSRKALAEILGYSHHSSIYQVEETNIKIQPGSIDKWANALGEDPKFFALNLFYVYHRGYYEYFDKYNNLKGRNFMYQFAKNYDERRRKETDCKLAKFQNSGKL